MLTKTICDRLQTIFGTTNVIRLVFLSKKENLICRDQGSFIDGVLDKPDNKLRILYRREAFIERLIRQFTPRATTEWQVRLQASHKARRSWNGNSVDVQTFVTHSHDQLFNLVSVAISSTGAMTEQHPCLTGLFTYEFHFTLEVGPKISNVLHDTTVFTNRFRNFYQLIMLGVSSWHMTPIRNVVTQES